MKTKTCPALISGSFLAQCFAKALRKGKAVLLSVVYCLFATGRIRLFVIYFFVGGLFTANSFSQGTWTQRANFDGTVRFGAVGFSIGTKGYIGTGTDGAEIQDFWEYVPAAVVGVNELSNPLNISINIIAIYPNPCSEYIHYTIASENGEAITVKVLDALGREVLRKEETLEAGITTNKLSIANLGSGLYLLRLTTKTQEKTQKQFVVK